MSELPKVDDVFVRALACTACANTLVWVDSGKSGMRPPTECTRCNSRLAPLVGQAAAEACWVELSYWHQLAERTLESVKLQLRYAAAVRREGLAQQIGEAKRRMDKQITGVARA